MTANIAQILYTHNFVMNVILVCSCRYKTNEIRKSEWRNPNEQDWGRLSMRWEAKQYHSYCYFRTYSYMYIKLYLTITFGAKTG